MKPGAGWPIAIVAILGATVAVNVVLLVAASDRRSTFVEPHYYHRAVDWDSTLAQARRDRELGWNLTLASEPDSTGGARLSARLVDRDGRTVEGASVRVAAISNVDPENVIRAHLIAGTSGAYQGRLSLPRSGLWELRFDITRGLERFEPSLHCDLATRVARS